MFLKRGNNTIFLLISFTLGVTVCYIACQFSYLKIDTEINVLDAVFSVLTIFIGLYIALILERKRNKSQNFYLYVEGKYDALWQDFIKLSETLEYSSNIELREVSKHFKSIDSKISPLIKILESFEYDSKLLLDIEEKIDKLEEMLSGSENISSQIIDLTVDKKVVQVKLNDINESFAQTLKMLNNLD